MIYLNSAVFFFQDMFLKNRTFVLVGHSFSFHPLFSECLALVLQLKFPIVEEVNTFLQCPGKRVSPQTVGMANRK